MVPVAAATEADVSHAGVFTLAALIAIVCFIWYIAVVLVCGIGYIQLWRYYSSVPPSSPGNIFNAPDVTIIRPVKGLEPSLYACLASTFRQSYPRGKLHIRFCISDRNDPALPVLERLLQDFGDFDAQTLVEEEDQLLQDGSNDGGMGPNPKIRNMSRAYREAKGDIIWIVDCNVWIAKGVAGRMVARLEGYGSSKKNKFVHQLPLVVDTLGTTPSQETEGLLEAESAGDDIHVRTTSTGTHEIGSYDRNISSVGGGRLEEIFMSSAHAKFYTAINTVLIAPCIVGKSTMFRRSHLNHLTEGRGIDYFSQNICEDHLIGDLLWKGTIPGEAKGEKWGKHAMVFGDLAIQPMAGMSVREYVKRRVRWLRVRKFTVTAATLVEPGTESFLCSLYGAFAVMTFLGLGWTAFTAFWLLSVTLWAVVDWTLYQKLHSAASVEVDADTPSFARPPKGGRRRPIGEWLLAWLGREALAFPVWFWAVWGGTTVEWRGKRFWVGMDMKVHEITEARHDGTNGSTHAGAVSAPSKARRD